VIFITHFYLYGTTVVHIPILQHTSSATDQLTSIVVTVDHHMNPSYNSGLHPKEHKFHVVGSHDEVVPCFITCLAQFLSYYMGTNSCGYL